MVHVSDKHHLAAGGGAHVEHGVVRLDPEHQGRQHGHGLLARNAPGLCLRHQEVVKPEIDFLAPNLLPGHIELVGEFVRVPGQHGGHRHVAAAGLGELLEVTTLDDLHQRRRLGPSPRDPGKECLKFSMERFRVSPERCRKICLEDSHHLIKVLVRAEVLSPVEFVKKLILSDDILETEVLPRIRVPVVDHLAVLVILDLAESLVPLLVVSSLPPINSRTATHCFSFFTICCV